MCIRVRFAPRDELAEPYDAERQVITIPDELALTALFTLLAVRSVLGKLGVEQDGLGARCWCGEQIGLLPMIPQQRSNEVINLGA